MPATAQDNPAQMRAHTAAEPVRSEGAGTARRLRLAYLTNQYPAVSHTFIRRELLEIERLGHSVLRLSIRRPMSKIVDPQDHAEQERTITCLSQPAWRLIGSAVIVATTRPRAFVRAIGTSFREGWGSGRGVLKRVAYLVEACYLLRTLRRERIQHVHVHFGTNAATVARLVRHLGGPGFSMVCHGSTEWDEPKQLDVGGKCSECVFSVGVSRYTVSQMMRWTPRKHWDRIHMVRCSVSESFFEEPAPMADDASSIVCVGRLSEEKGQPLLVEAFARALELGGEATSRARLIFIGDGPTRHNVEERIARFGLQSRVELLGNQPEDEVRRRLLASRGLALLSFNEGLPVVLMEALALARPVLATFIAGVPELVRSGENGWLVPAGDIEGSAQAIVEMFRTPVARLREMGTRGRALVVERHDPRIESRQLESLFLRYVPGSD
ncbi:MAG: glycosyltransferase [Phycisphaeraceae bacterium]|nr:glycosyltransferase [Phycisphaeraceae bacterium]